MKLQVIQLEPYDDVISVRDRLTFVNSERVLLVWPRAASVLRRKLDLVLIQREAARRGARLALITHDLSVIDYAAELNISTFESVDDCYRAKWKRPLSKVFIDRSDRPPDAPDAYELRLTASRLRLLTPRQRVFQQAVRIVTAIVLAVVLGAVVFLLVPNATITLYPAQTQINTTVKLVGDPSITVVNVETGHIPAALLVIDVTARASIPTTGSSDVPNTMSSGGIILTNQTTTEVAVPAGTVISTYGFKPARFRTTTDVTVEAGVGKTAEVTIEAMPDTAGALGNIEANLINVIEGPLSQSLAARNDQPTHGGSVRQQGIVTKGDYDNLLVLAREKIKQTSLAEFGPRLTGTQFIVPDSLKIVGSEETTYSAFPNDPADTLTLDLRTKVQALVIDEQLARQAALASLSAKIPNGRQVSPESVTFTRGAVQNVDTKGQVTFVMSASGNVAIVVNAEQIRQKLAGTNIGDALNVLERDLLLDPRRPPQIHIWPEILHRLPILPLRITIAVQE